MYPSLYSVATLAASVAFQLKRAADANLEIADRVDLRIFQGVVEYSWSSENTRKSAASIPVMLRYYQVQVPSRVTSHTLTFPPRLLRTVLPPIACLAYLYAPLFGRRDALKIVWLAFMVGRFHLNEE